MCFLLQKSPPKKSVAPKSILFLGPRAFCSWAYQGISYPVRGRSAAVNFKASWAHQVPGLTWKPSRGGVCIGNPGPY